MDLFRIINCSKEEIFIINFIINMSKFEKAINEYSYNYNERCKKGDNNFYFLNCYGE
jgi:hypothetical protein